MSEHYTEADVKVASRAIARRNMPNASEKLIDHLTDLGEWDDAARWVLEAVAPAIAARALRGHANRLDDYDAHDDLLLHVRRVVRDMRDRADEIERGTS